MSVKVQERAGVSLKRQFPSTLSEPVECDQEDCRLDGRKGPSHNRASVLYTSQCKLCEEGGVKCVYYGESSRSGHKRLKKHTEDITTEKESNALAKHLAKFHPDQTKEPDNFTFKLVQTYRSALWRQCAEGVKIKNSDADTKTARKFEYLNVVNILQTKSYI